MSGIPKKLRDLALKHSISVRRDAHGDYTVWDSTHPPSVRWPFYHMTMTGAIAAVHRLARDKAARHGKTVMQASGEKNPRRKRHSAKWDRCVRKVKKRGGAVDPYAVCTARVKNPQQWVLTATKARGGVYYYAGGARLTSELPFAMKFTSETAAARVKKMILHDFPTQLTRAYTWSIRAV